MCLHCVCSTQLRGEEKQQPSSPGSRHKEPAVLPVPDGGHGTEAPLLLLPPPPPPLSTPAAPPLNQAAAFLLFILLHHLLLLLLLIILLLSCFCFFFFLGRLRRTRASLQAGDPAAKFLSDFGARRHFTKTDRRLILLIFFLVVEKKKSPFHFFSLLSLFPEEIFALKSSPLH